MSKSMLWVEVEGNSVTLHESAKMPNPTETGYSWGLLDCGNGFTRKEFARWSGVEFPKGAGIYGLEIKLAIVKKMRVVTTKDYVAAERTTRKLVEVK